MIRSFRNFAKTKFAGILVFIMIIPFVFWGMGSMFSSGNTNNIVKIDNKNISTQDFIDHINRLNIPQNTIRENLDKNIIEELLATLVSSKLLNLEIEKFDIIISENTLLKKIKNNKNFKDEKGNFQRIKYEKFLLENNQSAAGFEQRLKNREMQKNLFDYIGAGTVTPKFLAQKLYNEETKKLEIEYLNLNKFYKKREDFTDLEIKKFLDDNKDDLKIEYLNFEYAIINPKNLIGIDEFNKTFFEKIDEIEIDISNDVDFVSIIQRLNIESTEVLDFRLSEKSNDIEKKIFNSRKIDFDIVESNDEYILYKINNSDERSPNINDLDLKKEIVELMFQKNKFEYNKNLLNKIQNKEFNEDKFIKLGKDDIKKITINSMKDNKKFDINSIELMYSLPINTFTMINDEADTIYLVKIKKFYMADLEINDFDLKQYIEKENTNNKNSILKTYDLLLNEKYNVVLNNKTIERVKNFFK